MHGESDRHVRDILGDHANGDREENDELTELLRMILIKAGGEITPSDALKELRRNGVTPPASTTLFRARKRAGIVAHKSAFSGGWVWSYQVAEDSTKIPKIPPSSDGESSGIFGSDLESSTGTTHSGESGEPKTAEEGTSPAKALRPCRHDGCDQPGRPYPFGAFCDQHIEQHRPIKETP